ncbi:hemerythrin domain-containing protein [Blastococcus sp. TML/M2B]|uniref:hemerythrin domain-containing protein n=1 Tax=unclassified Blastococcus TaxID=2619396 RepID=UPI00190BA7B1|nr:MULTISPECIES: hemerythrin domain-containing protein [unclassified Blastococcus]MBN1093368.1 hemerythrin domain-containing protein [Blastococcus sp. TML/M2B]MBN1096515.1 hemerythrin domain-containing protein [Blastococcus sp. TML/C7B]
MTAAHVGTATPVLPVPRAPADDALPAPDAAALPAPGGRAAGSPRVLHRLLRRELRLLADLLSWAPPDEPARTRALTAHVDLVSRLLLAHHRFEREALWPELLTAVPAGSEPGLRAAVATWTVRAARIDSAVRDLSTASRQWAVTGSCAARDALARSCRRIADEVDAHLAEEERVLVPLLEAHLDPARWAAVAAVASCRLTGRERRLVLGLALEDSCAAERARLLDGLPARRRLAWRVAGARRYRAAVVRLRGAPPAA